MAKNSVQQLKWALWVYIFVTWTAVCYAAETNALVAGIESIPPRAFLYVLLLAIVGGVAGTLTKLTRPDVMVKNLALEIAKDTMASIVAGMLAFFLTSWGDKIFNFWWQAIAITLAGYGGSKVLDMALAEGFFPWLSRVFGRTPSPPPPPAAREETPP